MRVDLSFHVNSSNDMRSCRPPSSRTCASSRRPPPGALEHLSTTPMLPPFVRRQHGSANRTPFPLDKRIFVSYMRRTPMLVHTLIDLYVGLWSDSVGLESSNVLVSFIFWLFWDLKKHWSRSWGHRSAAQLRASNPDWEFVAADQQLRKGTNEWLDRSWNYYLLSSACVWWKQLHE